MTNQTKTIKSRAVDILKALPSLFTLADISKFSNNPNVFLNRAIKNGYVEKAANKLYINLLFGQSPKPGIEQIACAARQPAYVSCEWALNYHGVLLQSPIVCTAITLSPTVGERNKLKYGGNIIEYSKISEGLFWGFDLIDGFNMARPEKALLDAIYLRRRIPFMDELEVDKLDLKQLVGLAGKYPVGVQKAVTAFIERSNYQSNYLDATERALCGHNRR